MREGVPNTKHLSPDFLFLIYFFWFCFVYFVRSTHAVCARVLECLDDDFSVLRCKNSLANHQIWANGFCRWPKSASIGLCNLDIVNNRRHMFSQHKTFAHSSCRRPSASTYHFKVSDSNKNCFFWSV